MPTGGKEKLIDICEAASRPGMRFVAVKGTEQQKERMLFRTRDLLTWQRAQTVNALREHLAEHNVAPPPGIATTERLINKLKVLPGRYYPAFIEAAPDLGTVWVLRLWELAPTPDRARRVSKASVEATLRKSHARASRAEKILAHLRGKAVPTAPGTIEAVSETAGRIVRRLKACDEEIKEIGRRTREAVGRRRARHRNPGVRSRNRHHHPGCHHLRSLRQHLEGLPAGAPGCYFGVAPVTKRSGREIRVRRTLAANSRLANAAHRWAMIAVQRDPASKAKYSALRKPRPQAREDLARRRRCASRRRLQSAPNRPDLRLRKIVESPRMKPE